jgi:hypothetical protein
MMNWSALTNLDDHQRAWEQAKERLGVKDVRSLSRMEYNDLIALAEEIRRGNVQ